MNYRVKTETGRRMKAIWGRADYVMGLGKGSKKRHNRSPEIIIKEAFGVLWGDRSVQESLQ